MVEWSEGNGVIVAVISGFSLCLAGHSGEGRNPDVLYVPAMRRMQSLRGRGGAFLVAVASRKQIFSACGAVYLQCGFPPRLRERGIVSPILLPSPRRPRLAALRATLGRSRAWGSLHFLGTGRGDAENRLQYQGVLMFVGWKSEAPSDDYVSCVGWRLWLIWSTR